MLDAKVTVILAAPVQVLVIIRSIRLRGLVELALPVRRIVRYSLRRLRLHGPCSSNSACTAGAQLVHSVTLPVCQQHARFTG